MLAYENEIAMTSDVFKWFRLGSQGTQYVIDHLGSGKPLSTSLLSVVGAKGYSYGLLPSDTESKAMEDFESGGKVGAAVPKIFSGVQPVQTADLAVASFIQTFIREDESRVGIFENLFANPSDKWLVNAKGVVTCGSHVYHVATSRATNINDIVAVLRSTRTPEFVGILTACSGLASRLNSPKPSMTESEIATMAHSAHMVMVGAYDGESVVAWSSNPLE
jgi:hypothetical protein